VHSKLFPACRTLDSKQTTSRIEIEPSDSKLNSKVKTKHEVEGFQRQVFKDLSKCNIMSLIINTSEDSGSSAVASVLDCFRNFNQAK
jgi:hypothetical protein